MKGLKPIKNEKEIKGGCWYFTVGSDIFGLMHISSPFKINGVPRTHIFKNVYYSVIARKIKTTIPGYHSYITDRFLSDSGVPSTHNNHKLFKYTTKSYNFLNALVDNQSRQLFEKMFVPCQFHQKFIENPDYYDREHDDFDDSYDYE